MTTVENRSGKQRRQWSSIWGPSTPLDALGLLAYFAGAGTAKLVVKAVPDLGYLHTGIEKILSRTKLIPRPSTLTDRMDYLEPHWAINLVYCLAVEKLLGLEIPKRAQYIRVMMVRSLQRISSHLVVARHACDRTLGR